jgi:arabinosaccharide transport system substrate-binding protein
MKKLLAFALALAIIPSALVFAQAKTDISLWTFQPVHVQFYQTMAEKWNAANPGKQINLKAEVFPYDDLHNKLLVSLQSGSGAPDISDIEVSKFANYLQGDIQLAPLNDVLAKDMKNFVKSRLDLYQKDGKYYGLDFHVGAEIMFYNVEMCKAAGVDIDKIKTWSDYIKAGQQVVAKTGKPMCTIESTEHWSFYPLLSMAGSDVLDKNNKVILDNDTNTKVLKLLYDMIYKYKIAVTAPGGFHHSDQYYGFMNDGGAASIWMPYWYLNRFTDYMPDLKGKMAIRPMPIFDGSPEVYGIKSKYTSTGMGGTGTAVIKTSKNLELAKAFLYYAKGSKEGQIEIWKQLGFDPLRTDVWTDKAVKEPNKFTAYYQNGTGLFDVLTKVKDGFNGTNVSGNYPAIIDTIKHKVMFQVLSDKSKTPEQALKDAADELRK